MKTFSFLLPIILIIALQSSNLKADARTTVKTRSTVKIGAIIPLTGFGARFGIPAQRSIQMLIDEYNDSERKYHYQVIFEDGKCGSGKAPANAANKLINLDQVKFLITGCSGETLVVGPVAERKKVITMAICSNHQKVRELGDYVYRTFYDIEESLKDLNKVITENGHKKVIILAEENAFTQGMADTMAKLLQKRMLYREDYSGDLPDFRALATKFRSSKTDGIFLACAGAETCIDSVKQIRSQRIQAPIYSYYYFDQPDVLSGAGAAADGIVFAAAPDIKGASQGAQSFMKRLIQKHSDVIQDEFAARSAHDGLQAILDSIEVVGPYSDKVKNYLDSYSSRGALGPISFDSAGDIENLRMDIKRVTKSGTELVR